jgi:hypothetical protein
VQRLEVDLDMTPSKGFNEAASRLSPINRDLTRGEGGYLRS